MIKKTYKLTIDLKNGIMNYNVVSFITEDKGCNSLEITLLDSATQYNLTGNTTRFVAKTPSGAILQQNCTNKGGNVITIDLNQSFFTEQGIHTCEVQIYDTANQTLRVTFPSFKYNVTKSLMNDDNIQADSNFTILQDMINNVQNADRVSTEALETANEAKVIVDTLVPQANTAAQNAQTALDRAESVVTQEELAQKVMLDGKDTKFDFIENKVVQDGLIYENRVVTNRVNSGIILTNNFTISMTLSASSKTDNQYFLGNYSDSRGLYLFCNNGVIKLIIDTIALDTIKPEPNEFYNVSIVCIEGECSVFINGIKYTHTVRYVPNNIRLAFGGYNGSSGELGTGKLKNVLIYNLPRAPQEIQNNFSVLNNLPSIKELHTTDSTGKTSILNFGSDSNHVEMQDGRTLEEDYTALLKTMGKEFVSADGSPIQVPSGIEARVINAEIEGQTIKNELANSVPAKILSGSDNFMSLKLLLGNYTRIYVYAECKH